MILGYLFDAANVVSFSGDPFLTNEDQSSRSHLLDSENLLKGQEVSIQL